MTTTQNRTIGRTILGAVLATSISVNAVAPVHADDACSECEATQWDTQVSDIVLEGDGFEGELVMCAIATLNAVNEALEYGEDYCATAAPPDAECLSGSNSCPPGYQCELGFSLGELHKEPIRWGFPVPDEIFGCEGTQDVHCFCHCVPDDQDDDSESDGGSEAGDIATPAPTTTPTPAKSPTPQPSRIA